jgi:hypothetical protein
VTITMAPHPALTSRSAESRHTGVMSPGGALQLREPPGIFLVDTRRERANSALCWKEMLNPKEARQ